MSNLSDFRALVLSCLTDEWGTLEEIANTCFGGQADYAYRLRVANALWHWEQQNSIDKERWPLRYDDPELRWRRTQEADHAD